jgi:hypothetical protein
MDLGTSVLNLPRLPRRKRVSALSRGAQHIHPRRPTHPDPNDHDITPHRAAYSAHASQEPESLGGPCERPHVADGALDRVRLVSGPTMGRPAPCGGPKMSVTIHCRECRIELMPFGSGWRAFIYQPGSVLAEPDIPWTRGPAARTTALDQARGVVDNLLSSKTKLLPTKKAALASGRVQCPGQRNREG